MLLVLLRRSGCFLSFACLGLWKLDACLFQAFTQLWTNPLAQKEFHLGFLALLVWAALDHHLLNDASAFHFCMATHVWESGKSLWVPLLRAWGTSVPPIAIAVAAALGPLATEASRVVTRGTKGKLLLGRSTNKVDHPDPCNCYLDLMA